jgi:RNA polymerase sigma-70 factor (ECF subfamily)
MKSPFDKLQFDRLDRLARRMKRGDQRAAEALYEELVDKVFGFCMHRVRERKLAEDLTQEIFLKLVRHIRLYEERRGHFVVWFWRMARNTLVDHFRHTRRSAEFFSEPLEEAHYEVPQARELGEALDHKLRHERLASSLSKLGEEEQELFRLRYVAELSYGDIAELLDKSEGALRVAAMRLKKKLRTILEA